MPTERQFDQATAWIARLRDVYASDSDRGRFADWLHQDPAHCQAFDQMMDLWDQLGDISELPQEVESTPARWATSIPLALAACVMGAAIGLVLVFGGTEQFGTRHGEQKVVDLDDGSRVILNTDSVIEIGFEANVRSVEIIQGQAFFEVEPDADRPFVVRTDWGTVEVVGTAFDVHERSQEAVVTVSTGRVRIISNAGETIELSPDQQGRIDATATAVRSVDAARVNAWRNGQLVYDGVPFNVLIDDLNRYLPRKMTIADPELASARVSAVLKIEDQAAMLEALGQSLDLRWSVVSDNLIIIQSSS